MFFDNFSSKFFGKSANNKNPLNDSYYYDSNGVIKTFEKIIENEKQILHTLQKHEKESNEIGKTSSLSPDFVFLYERMNHIECEMQEKVVHLEEDFVYIMKNMVAMEKEVISMINKIRNHPKLKEDNKLWDEITKEHLPRLRIFGNIMDKYAEKRQKELEEGI